MRVLIEQKKIFGDEGVRVVYDGKYLSSGTHGLKSYRDAYSFFLLVSFSMYLYCNNCLFSLFLFFSSLLVCSSSWGPSSFVSFPLLISRHLLLPHQVWPISTCPVPRFVARGSSRSQKRRLEEDHHETIGPTRRCCTSRWVPSYLTIGTEDLLSFHALLSDHACRDNQHGRAGCLHHRKSRGQWKVSGRDALFRKKERDTEERACFKQHPASHQWYDFHTSGYP